MLKTFILLCILSLPLLAELPAYLFYDVLPRGTHQAEVLMKKLPKNIVKIQKKMTKAVSKNEEWFHAYVTKYQGQQVPHHKNFGISPMEYQLIGGKITKELWVSDTVDLQIDYSKEALTIIINDSSYIIDTITLHFADSTIHTKWGVAHFKRLSKNHGVAPLKFNGRDWSGDIQSPYSIEEEVRKPVSTGENLRLNCRIGVLHSDGASFLSYSVAHWGKNKYGLVDRIMVRFKHK